MHPEAEQGGKTFYYSQKLKIAKKVFKCEKSCKDYFAANLMII